MTYATRADIIAIYGDDFLTNLTPPDLPDADAAVDQALADAGAEIDGYLSARYALPLGRSPLGLRRPCIDIAAYVLANSHTRLTTTIEDRYKHATDYLTKIAKGVIGLGLAEPVVDAGGGAASGTSGAAFSARPRRFGRGRG